MAWHGSRCSCCTPSRGFFATDAISRVDPTGTSGVRRRYEADLVRRMKRVRTLIWEAVVKNDVLGQGVQAQTFMRAHGRDARTVRDNAPPRHAFAFERVSSRVESFMEWLREMIAREVIEVEFGSRNARSSERSWQNIYIRSAYVRGLDMAGDQIRRAGARVDRSWITGAFNRAIHADRIGLIFTRAYSALRGITDEMERQIARVLAQGMAEGRGPMAMARALAARVDKIGITRARVLARTEVIAAHAEASLNSYREAQVEGVNLMAEWSTAKDNAVCAECAALEGREFTIAQAEGMLPRHPNCRCAWIPIVKTPAGLVLT